MEAINETSKSVAKVLEMLKTLRQSGNDDNFTIEKSIAILEEALEKLVVNI
ncbi:MAG TPA: hypothetical protein VJ279_08570 [Hanamia sp.]|jgi:hypothetical protein|nr:hypothetical protein [Hanamia sp.]